MRHFLKLSCMLGGLCLVLGLSLVLTVPGTLASSLWYVSTTGSDANSCSNPAAPCATVGAALSKPGFVAGDTICVATGTYTGTGNEVVLLNKSAVLSGGWNNAFTTQAGHSTLDANTIRRGLTVNDGLAVTVDRFIIEHGFAEGGGVRNSGSLTLTNSIIRDNSANNWPWSGGGISSSGVLHLLNSTVSGNVSFFLGDGVVSYGTTIVDNSAIIGNSGHGIFHSGFLTVTNSTFSGNAGIALDFGGDATVAVFNNVTIAKNGAGFNTQGANNVQVRARNSIIAGNTSSDCVGYLTSLGYNIIGNTANCNITSGPGDQLNVNPGLSVLIGSPAFYPLSANSPAVDAGNPAGCQGLIGLLITDQRGVARDAHCDIGAFEYVTPGPAATLQPIDAVVHTLPPSAPDPSRFKVLVLDSLGNLANNVVVTFTAPASGSGGIFATTGTHLATALTGSDGMATAPAFTSNAQLGDYHVSASVSGVTPVEFLLRNVIWYVSAANGSPANTCISPTSPCPSFDWLLNFSELTDNHQVRVATGTYRGSQMYVLPINHSLKITGGWNESFTQQTGVSVLDGENARGGISAGYGLTITLERLAVRNALAGISSSADSFSFSQGSIQDSVQRGIVLSGGQARLSNLTIARNGGGLSVGYGVSVTLASSTIAGNRADTGGGIYNIGGTVLLKNSLVAGNFISTTGGVDCAGTLMSIGYSLVGQTTGCTVITSIGDLLNVDPQQSSSLLGTPAYYSLRLTSPAINAGDPAGCTDASGAPLTIDVRDAARAGRCDVGSYEYLTPTAPATQLILSGTPQYARPGDLFADQFRVAVLDNNGTSVNNGLAVAFAAPASGASGTFSDTGSITTTALTDLDGIATASLFRANNQAGSYTVVASIAGASAANFQLFNSAAWYVSPTGNDANSCLLTAAPCATLNGVMAKMQSGDEAYVAEGTYWSSSDAVALVNKSVRMSGGWNADFTAQTGTSLIDGASQRRGVMVTANVNVELDRFTIQNGRAGAGGGLHNAGHLMLTNLTMVNNDCNTGANPSYGGAIYNAGVLTVSHAFASHNGTCYHGGAVFNDSAGLVMLDTVDFATNDAWSGGSIENQGRLIMSNSFIHNSLAGYAILYLEGQNGGGLYNLGTAIITTTSFARNAAYNGGGVFNTGSLILRNSTIISNSVNTYASGRAMGAGIHNAGGTLLLENSAVLENTGYDSTIWTTTPPAPPYGGGIFNSSVMTVNNSLIAGNRVMKSANAADPPLGGGAYNTGALTFNNSTIVHNRALSGGNAGGLFSEQGTLRVHNTLVVSNTAEGTSPDCSGAITSAGYNLIGTTQSCAFTASGGDYINTAAHFLLPANSTDYRLQYDSPAVNGGDPAGCVDTQGQPLPSIDFRGLPRPIGRCDIGAVEMQALETSSKQASRSNVRPGTWVSYTLVLRNVSTDALDPVLLTDTLPSSLHYQAGSLTAPAGTYQYKTGTITWTGPLTANALFTITYGAQLDAATVGGTAITNRALFQGAGTIASMSSVIHARWETALPLVQHNFCSDFIDDFSSPRGWPVGDNAYVRAEYLNGEYRLLTKQTGYLYVAKSPGCAQGNYVVEADARWDTAHGDGYALVFGITPNFDRYVVFYVSPDYGEYALWHEMNGTMQLAPFTRSAAVHTGGATNHMKVIVQGYNITLVLNGVTLGTWYDGFLTGETGAGLAVAPLVASPIADARFDNFSVVKLISLANQSPTPSLDAPAAPPDGPAPTRSGWRPYRIDRRREQTP